MVLKVVARVLQVSEMVLGLVAIVFHQPKCFLHKYVTYNNLFKRMITAMYCLQVPNTSEEWENIAKEFEKKWNVFNTIGALDGKYIRINCPRGSGWHYFNYKHFNSIILFA